jgi:simple sugar transport system permease protein
MSKSALVRLKAFLANRPEGGAIVGVVALFVFFSLGTEHFLAVKSFRSMLTLAAYWGIAAGGVTLLMISGEFDLSVGSMLGLSAMGVALMVNAGLPSPIAVVMMLIVCVAFGLLQGLAVVKLGIPSFIITLGGMLLFRAITYLIHLVVVQGDYVRVPQDDAFYQILSYRFESGFNITPLWFLGITVILYLILHWTRFGNWIFATGGNKLAAIQSGVPVNRVKVILFGLTSGLACLAGIFEMTRFPSVGPQGGKLLEMYLIAMVVMGGTRLIGGYGSVVGTVFGLAMMAMMKNGLSLMGVSAYWYNAVVGIIILIAVIVNVNSQRRALGVGHE